MTPETPEEELSPADEAAVRRLLAAAAEPVTMPDDVASRLDDVLAQLQAERVSGAPEPVAGHEAERAPVASDLAARRRRRWPQVLAAAATVAVVAAGVGTIVQDQGGETSGDAARSADEPAAELAPSPETSQDTAGGAGAMTDEERTLTGDAEATSTLPRVRTGSATVDAQRIHDLSLTVQPDDGVASRLQPNAGRACDLPAAARGEDLVAVRYNGSRATLLFGLPEQGRRRAEVYSCDDGQSPMLVTTVRAR